MVFGNFIDIFALIQVHGYWILLLATLIEGPIASAAGGFAASIGALNLFWVILISFAGDIIADSFYYFMGKFGRKHLIDRYGMKFGLSKKRMRKIEKNLKNHFFKTLAVMKLTPMLAPPGLMMIGASKISFKRLLFNSLIIIVPVSLFYTLCGYYLGLAFDSFFKYFKLARNIFIGLIIVIAIIAYFVERRVSSGLVRKIEKI